MKIGVLYICTGKYSLLWDDFYNSCEKYFLINHQKHYYVFTDSIKFKNISNPNITIIFQEPLKWPLITLFRYNIFLNIEKSLLQNEYLFFFNADAEFVKPINEKMIIPRKNFKEKIVVVQHAGYFNAKNYEFCYDRNILCKAFIPYGRGRYYVCGGINGGESKEYIKMCHKISKNVNRDYKRGIIALWHDESYLNKYIVNYKHYRILPPSFASPSFSWWKTPYEHIIEVRAKEKYFDVKKIKSYKVLDCSPNFWKKINKIMKTFAKRKIFRSFMNFRVCKKNVG